jgi:tetratricopeptide (TPR) repeat protein
MSIHIDRALLLYRQQRHEQAEMELRRGLADEPNNSLAHSLLALCLSRRKVHREATEEARQAIALEPGSAFAHYALSEVMYSRDRYDEAEKAIGEAIRIDPSSELYRGSQAAIYYAQGLWQDALAAAEEGLALDAEDVVCNNMRAMALVKLGRRDEATATIGSALARDPENAWTHANQGWTLLHKSKPKEALEHFREALRLDPELEFARAGIVESMKARFVFYRLMLRFFLWMSCHGRRFRWAVVVGGAVGFRLLHDYLEANPRLKPFAFPLMILYVGFASLSWLADPLFNLMLRLNRHGRYALSHEQVGASNWVGLCLAATVLLAVLWFCLAIPDLGFAVFAFLILAIPTAAVYKCLPGWPRKTMAAVAISLAVAATGGAALLIAGWAADIEVLYLLGVILACLGVIGGVAATWIANFLAMFRPKK